MAIDFAQPTLGTASSTFLRRGSAVCNWDDVPVSFFIWFKPNASNFASIDRKLIWIVNDPPGFGGADKFGIGFDGGPGGSHGVFCTASHTFPAVSSISTTTWDDLIDQWQSVGGTIDATFDGDDFVATIAVQVFHNGVAGPLETTWTGNLWFRDFENTYIGSSPTSSAGTDNGGFGGCWAHACIWVGVKLSAQDYTDLHAGASPDTIHPENLAMWVPGDDLATAVAQYAWDGAAVTQTTDMTLNTSGNGSIATCVDSPDTENPEPEPEPEPTPGGAGTINFLPRLLKPYEKPPIAIFRVGNPRRGR